MRKIYNILLGFIIIFTSCSKEYLITRVENSSIHIEKEQDSSINAFLKPYSDTVENKLNIKIGESSQEMIKDFPEGLLGNFITDLILNGYKDKNVDICIMNNGGFRCPINKGDISHKNIFELMPFDNKLVILEADFKTMKKIADYIKARNKAAVSGMRIKFKNNETQTFTVNNNNISEEKTYRVITSDYLANGGDNMNFFTNLKREELNVLLRDAIVNLIIEKHKDRKKLKSKLDGRIKFE